MKKAIMLLAFATLAACGGGETAEKADAPASEAAAPAEGAGAAGTALIPANFHGAWAMKGTNCAEDSDTRITVTGNEIRFREAVATITKAEAGDMDSYTLDADYAAEGATSKVQYSLAPSEAGKVLSLRELADGTDVLDYERCEG